MKKKVVFISVGIIFLICAVIVIIVRVNSSKVGTFNLNDYKEEIDNFPSEEELGAISGPKDALKKAEKLFIELYGNSVKKWKPYKIFYDEENGVWLIEGSTKFFLMSGGVGVLIKDSGEVLAVWHGK